MASPYQIDPVGCGCTECLTGEYIPLNRASAEQVFALLTGEMIDATSEQFTLTSVTTDYLSGRGTRTDTITAEFSGLTWTIPPRRA